jgi:hypothetical protein
MGFNGVLPCEILFPDASPHPFSIFCDNQSTCVIAKSDTISSRTKHIDVRHHFIRHHVNEGSFATVWIPTTDMTADIFTKPLLSTLFLHHSPVLMGVC